MYTRVTGWCIGQFPLILVTYRPLRQAKFLNDGAETWCDLVGRRPGRVSFPYSFPKALKFLYKVAFSSVSLFFALLFSPPVPSFFLYPFAKPSPIFSCSLLFFAISISSFFFRFFFFTSFSSLSFQPPFRFIFHSIISLLRTFLFFLVFHSTSHSFLSPIPFFHFFISHSPPALFFSPISCSLLSVFSPAAPQLLSCTNGTKIYDSLR